MIFYELKISYTRQTGEDNPKAVKETYLVEGLTAADVEERLLGEIQKYISGEWETKSCKQVQFYDLIPNPEGDQWYKARVEMITIEDNGKIGFRDDKFDELFGGRDKLTEYMSEMDREACLALFDDYKQMSHETY